MKTNDPKPITLIVTIYPPKKGVRKVIVSGAPNGEMPVLLGGPFQDRHVLLDQAYAAVVKRDPQLVTIKESVSRKGAKTQSEEEPGNREPDEGAENVDQLVEELPAIEGDEVLSDISSPAESGEVSTLEEQILAWKDGEHGEQD
jgi:hypothetical protein